MTNDGLELSWFPNIAAVYSKMRYLLFNGTGLEEPDSMHFNGCCRKHEPR